MAKHPVPKKKTPKSVHRTRHSAFQRIARKKISDGVVLVDCKECGQPKRSHYACPTCGTYRGRKVLQFTSVTEKKGVQKVKV